MPVGLGFDIHRLVPGRPLLLGGVRFDHPLGLLGHSDGDVVLHAVIDALLGACGGGDIGEKFPDTDPRWKDADSALLFRTVISELTPRWTVENIDVTIIAEEPKLGARKKDVAAKIASLSALDAHQVVVKAKTAEGLGAVGHREGIACLAVVLTRVK
jgi:2-C-methyl-D-erythritol 2,4-cyclodiphosphate synthase